MSEETVKPEDTRKPRNKKNKTKKLSAFSFEECLEQITRKYGTEAIVDMSNPLRRNVDVIPCGSFAVDVASGVFGLPRGRIVEILGPESSGKTTLLLQTIASAQSDGGKAGFVDTEHALDIKYAEQLGVKPRQLIISQPDCGEDALDIVETMVRSGSFKIVTLDSVAAIVPRAELEGQSGDSIMGVHARLMSQALRKLVSLAKKTNTLVLFTNQIRMKIGVLFGNPETTTGGNALKFYASMRIDIRKAKKIGETAIETNVKFIKNKLAIPFTIASTRINYGKGFDFSREVLECGLDNGIFMKRGNAIYYEDKCIGKGMDSAVSYLDERRDFVENVASFVKESMLNSNSKSEELKDLEEKLKASKKEKNRAILQKKINKLKEEIG